MFTFNWVKKKANKNCPLVILLEYKFTLLLNKPSKFQISSTFSESHLIEYQ